MKRLILWALCVLLLLPAGTFAETVSVKAELEFDLPDDFAALFSDEALRKLAVTHAEFMEGLLNGRNQSRYATACSNWKANYTGQGVCNELPLPPMKVSVTAFRYPMGWWLKYTPLPEPVTEVCQFEDDFLEILSKECREKIGAPEPPPLPAGVIEVIACYKDARCQAGPRDTIPHGEAVEGANFPDGRARFKVIRATPFGKVGWYQPDQP